MGGKKKTPNQEAIPQDKPGEVMNAQDELQQQIAVLSGGAPEATGPAQGNTVNYRTPLDYAREKEEARKAQLGIDEQKRISDAEEAQRQEDAGKQLEADSQAETAMLDARRRRGRSLYSGQLGG